MKKVKCGNCGKIGTFSLCKTGIWYWARCLRCGFHTSSYLTPQKAKQAARDGEHYISENGNKCIG